jgi:hypothetical protein
MMTIAAPDISTGEAARPLSVDASLVASPYQGNLLDSLPESVMPLEPELGQG